MWGPRLKTWLFTIGFVLAIVVSFAVGDSMGQCAMFAAVRV